ncbi:MAG: BrnA antitoxin family protein [Thiohalocapsa sp.]
MHVKSKPGRILDLPSLGEEARIRTGIAADPDTYELSDEEIAQLRPKAEVRKVPATIRFDADVLKAMKATRPG